MPDPPAPEITGILAALARGEPGADAELRAFIYGELHRMARSQMAQESPGHTLQPTALVNEAYLRLLGGSEQRWENRAHFFGAAGEAMRRILVEHARAKGRAKRGGGLERVDLDRAEGAADDPDEVLSLDAALARLEEFDPRMAEIVKMRCFVGMSIAETAAALGVAARTVDRQWTLAKAWLRGELRREDDGLPPA